MYALTTSHPETHEPLYLRLLYRICLLKKHIHEYCKTEEYEKAAAAKSEIQAMERIIYLIHIWKA